ncbi:MAG: hypothetical protein JW814_04785 [Candidatus Krumholzibacteriota bacterium]|nr:hypothetical protein [Candidatus Krumholzibacteriota bacterium]
MTGRFGRIDYFLLVAGILAGLFATSPQLTGQGISAASIILASLFIILAARPIYLLLIKMNEGRRKERAVITVVFAFHLIATLFFFPPEEIVNADPVITLDHSIHYYQIARSRDIFWRDYRLYTYDPYFMAGYPGGVLFDIDSKGVELWSSLLAFFDPARTYKLFILISHLLLVFTIYAGCRNLLYSFEESLYALLLFLVFWHWGRPYAGDFRFVGMFAFLLVSHLSLYICGLFRKFLNEERVIKFYFTGPLAFFLHPTAAVILPAPFIALFFSERRLVIPGIEHRQWEKRILLRMLLWCLLVIVINLAWLIPLFRYIDLKTPSETFFQIHGVAGLGRLLFKPGNIPALFLLAMAVAGTVRLISKKQYTKAAAPLAGSVFLILLAGFGIYIPIYNQMEPGRFLFSAFVFLAPLAGTGLSMTSRFFFRDLPGGKTAPRLRAAMIFFLLALIPFFSMIESREYYRHTLTTRLPSEIGAMIEALKRYTDPSGRLMIEAGVSASYRYSYLPSIIPLYTGVEQIGGPHPHFFIKHNFASFRAEDLFGSSLEKIDRERLGDYIRLYNVRWLLTVSTGSTGYFRNYPQVSPLWSYRDIVLWNVSSSLYPEYPSGMTVRADYGKIIVRFETGRSIPEKVLLPYHYDRGLIVDRPAEISGKLQLDDPVPFILLEPGGEREIEIRYR